MFRFSVSLSRIAVGLSGIALLGGLGLLAGCPSNSADSSSGASAAVAQGAVLSGTVMGGRQPVVGSLITAYTAGQGGTPAAVIGTATTDAQGNFSIPAFSPVPTTDQIVYVTAAGGDGSGSGTPNTAILLGTVAGVCADYGCTNLTGVNVNELGSAAMVYSLGGFMTITGNSVDVAVQGDDANALAGITNAAETFANLVDGASGKAAVPGAGVNTCTGGGEPVNCGALRTLDTLANVAAACVNSSTAAAGACTGLFNVTTTSNGNVPGNVFQALYNVATDSGVRNDGSGLFGLNPQTLIYSPGLNAAPDAWTIALNYGGNGLDAPYGVAVDAAGNVWVANNGGNSISKFGPTGAPILTTSAAGQDAPIGIAVDSSGNVWTANNGNGSISGFAPDGTPAPPIATAGSGLDQPYGVAANQGYVGTASFGNATLNLFNSGNAAFMQVTGFVAGPVGIASGTGILNARTWVTAATANKLCQYYLFFSPQCTAGGGLSTPYGVAIDKSGHVWVASFGNSTVNSFTPGGIFGGGSFASHTGFTGGGLNQPYGITTDAAGNVWVSNGNSSVSEFGSGGTALSPTTGYTGGGLGGPAFFSIAVDASGNLWVSNAANDSLTEFVGLAAPTRTPLTTAVNGSAGFKP